MNKTYIPAGYKPVLDAYDTQRAIAYIKQTFQDEFSGALNLKRVSAPLFVTENSGLNDNLNGYERAVSFDVPAVGMDVYGCDPHISVEAAWHLDRHVQRVKTNEEIYANCDVITLHVPLLDSTRKMINAEAISKMKDGVIILNFARDLLVDDDAMAEALASGKVSRYVTDFPNEKTANMPGCIAIPHLGASTEESEDNCAKMAVRQVMNYVENGNIVNSVNFPSCDMGLCTKPGRILILHRNIPNSLGRLTSAVAKENVNISDLLNRSKGEYACTMLDLDEPASAAVVDDLKNVEGECADLRRHRRRCPDGAGRSRHSAFRRCYRRCR